MSTARNSFQIMEKFPVFAPSHLPGFCRSANRSGSLKIVLELKSKVLACSDVLAVLVRGVALQSWLGLQTCLAQTPDGCYGKHLLCLFTQFTPKMARDSAVRVRTELSLP